MFKRTTHCCQAVAILVTLFTVALPCLAATSTWKGGTGDWSVDANWTNNAPGVGDDAIINAGSVLLTSPTAVLRTLTVNGGTLTFSNWTTRVEASNVVINAGALTLPVPFTDVQMSNRVWIVCTNFTLATNATINATQKGYARGGYGPGAGSAVYGGSGHGGRGGDGEGDLAGGAYDDIDAPTGPGTGGHSTSKGGHGGGAVRIAALDKVTIYGSITANAGNGLTSHGAGGSGGSIYISCKKIAGSPNGLLQANGGNGNNAGGGGAGGRIAIIYNTAAQASEPDPGIRMQAKGGTQRYYFRAAENGTVYLPDENFLSAVMKDALFKDVFVTIPGFTNWVLDSLMVSNCSFVLANTGTVVTITNNLTITNGGFGVFESGEIHCNDLTLSGASTMSIYGGITNGGAIHGALVSVTGNMVVAGTSAIYPYTHNTNGGAVRFIVGGDVTVQAGTIIYADGKGFDANTGPGHTGTGNYGRGASHGGKGAPFTYGAYVDKTYGSLTMPILPGSGGGKSAKGGLGGGVIWIEATNGTVTVRGTLTASGWLRNIYHDGSGAGGSIYIECRTLAGDSGGLLRVNGGNCSHSGGAGGGGRISVIYDKTAQAGANPGVRFEAAAGTGGFKWGDKFAKNGTLYLSDASFLSAVLDNDQFDDVYATFGNVTSLILPSLTINDCDLAIANTNMVIVVSNTLAMTYRADFAIMNGSSLVCSNLTTEHDIVSGDSSVLRLYAGPTNGATPDYGALLTVRDTMTIVSNAWIYPYSDRTNGGSPLFRVRNLNVNEGGGFFAHATGFGCHQGTGRGTILYAGGGYGGEGGSRNGGDGIAYGSMTAPIDPGSSAFDSQNAGSGGGLIRIESSGLLDLQGTLNAKGYEGGSTHGAGGAGGGIFLKCWDFRATDNAQLLAYGGGGRGNGGGGGGGRIAVWRFMDTSTGTPVTNVTPGTGYYVLPHARGAETGTVFWVITAPAITNHPVTNVGVNQADMVGELTATGFSPTIVRCYWGEIDGGDQLDAWGNTNSFGYTNVSVITNNITTLTAGTVYHYRFYCTNDAGQVWATPTEVFAALGTTVTVDNATGAADIEPDSASLRGNVTQGNPSPDVYVCWGDANGGNDTGNWQNVVSLGPKLGAFDVTITNLAANKQYYYHCYAENMNTNDWADEVTNFYTIGPYVSINDPAIIEGDAGTSNMDFTVSLSTTSIVDISVFFTSTNGTAESGSDYTLTNGTLIISAGQPSGIVTVKIIGDSDDEFPSENLYLNLAAPTNCSIVDAQGVGTITDNDGIPLTNTWTGTADWTDTGGWSEASLPRTIDYAVIASGNVLLSSSDEVYSLTVQSGAVMTFSNWTTCLTANDVLVEDGGEVTAAGPISIVDMTNRVHFACTNLTVATNGLIDVSYKGYVLNQGTGKGVGSTYGSGGGHGSDGGENRTGQEGGRTYGSYIVPETHGSGGGDNVGGDGGGVIRIDASDAVTVFGSIKANGENGTANYGGGGAAGSILINCRTLEGSANGLIQANGGRGNGNGGRGGGGRIAVHYDTAAQAGIADPGVRFQAAQGTTGWKFAEDGTLYLPDTNFLSGTMKDQLFRDLVLYIPGFTNWSLDSLSISNCGFTFGATGFVLTVANDLSIDAGELGFKPYAQANIGGDFTLTNSSLLWLYAGPTNPGTPAYGGLIDVTGSMSIASGCWVYPYSDATNGGSILVKAGDLTVQSGGGFNADKKGWDDKFGPGAGDGTTYGTGGGYGGRGSVRSGGTTPSDSYGAPSGPPLPGSGGGSTSIGGNGGGLIWIQATGGTVTIHGTLTADGEAARTTHGAGGSGGGIFITCQRFEGSSSGSIETRGGGGNNGGGPGGGGRIAIIYDTGVQAGYDPQVRTRTSMGSGGYYGGMAKIGHDGTLYLPDSSFLSSTLTNWQFRDTIVYIPGFTNWALGSLLIDGASLAFGQTGITINVSGAVTIKNSGELGLPGNARFTCRNLDLDTGYLTVQGGETNGVHGDWGALVNVIEDMTLTNSSWVYPMSHQTNGASPLFRMKNLTVDDTSGFNAKGRGHSLRNGPGKGGSSYGAGGYGGAGGNGSNGGGGSEYGSSNAPAQCGSGGYYLPNSGSGGGLIWIEAVETVSLYGELNADGENAFTTHGAGGSGGGILVSCFEFINGASANMHAKGGNYNGNGGGGGGGRIAVWTGGVKPYDRTKIMAGNEDMVSGLVITNGLPGYLGSVSVANGTYSGARVAEVGTIMMLSFNYPPGGTVFMFR